MGVNNAGMPGPLKAAMVPALKYIADQKFPCLTGLTAFQIGICNIKPQWPAQIQLPTKFLYSISEQIVVPLLADATVSLGNTYKIIEAGRIYRFNNRVQSTIVQSPDFLAMVIIYLNKDLYGNLTDEELTEIRNASSAWYDYFPIIKTYQDDAFLNEVVTLLYVNYKTDMKFVWKKKILENGGEKVIRKD
jgi:hypothetical protein